MADLTRIAHSCFEGKTLQTGLANQRSSPRRSDVTWDSCGQLGGPSSLSVLGCSLLPFCLGDKRIKWVSIYVQGESLGCSTRCSAWTFVTVFTSTYKLHTYLQKKTFKGHRYKKHSSGLCQVVWGHATRTSARVRVFRSQSIWGELQLLVLVFVPRGEFLDFGPDSGLSLSLGQCAWGLCGHTTLTLSAAGPSGIMACGNVLQSSYMTVSSHNL